MSECCKPGGGNKPQPYIPKGNGDKSGEYTEKPKVIKKIVYPRQIKNCYIRNVRFKYNFLNSILVKKVTQTFKCRKGDSISKNGKPYSVVKKIIDGYVVTERYYNNKGEAYLDIDYTCHNNIVTHPYVPHIHRWIINENGILQRQKWEKFK